MDEDIAVSGETDAAATQDDATVDTTESAVDDSAIATDAVNVDADETSDNSEVTDESASNDTDVENEDDSEATESVDDEVTSEDADEESAAFDNIDEANKAIKKLRKENARRRSLNNDIDSAFETSSEEFRQGWLEIARMLNGTEEEQEEAVAVLSRYVGGTESVTDSSEVPSYEDSSEESILSKVGQIFDEREQRLAVQAQQAAISLEVQELGYNSTATPDTNPEEYAAHRLLWDFVSSQPDGQKDLKAAHAQVKAFESAVLNRKLTELKNANKGLPSALSGISGSASVVEDTEPVSAHDVMKKAEEKSIAFYEERNSSPRF